MKLDAHNIRYLTQDEFRVLTAVEMGMKNHELVPTPLIEKIASLKHGGAQRALRNLLKFKLIKHEAKRYDGYSLKYQGYDFLAIKTFVNRGLLKGVGRQIGVGKESGIPPSHNWDINPLDIYIVINDDDKELVMKLQRLGRPSFRTVRNKRDYLKGRQHASWLYMSRLGALKEFAFMKALHGEGFPVPEPIDWNRHAILMSVVDGYQLVLDNPTKVARQCIDLIVRLASYGLIHGDFNEFNLMVDESEKVTMIDFPQMISTSHKNAEMYFNRDIECIQNFFKRRFNVVFEDLPKLSDIIKEHDLDVAIEASGYSKQHAMQFEEMEDVLLNEEEGEEEEEEEKEPNEEETEPNEEEKKTNDKDSEEEDELQEEENQSNIKEEEEKREMTERELFKLYNEKEIKRKVKQELLKRGNNFRSFVKQGKKKAQKGKQKYTSIDW